MWIQWLHDIYQILSIHMASKFPFYNANSFSSIIFKFLPPDKPCSSQLSPAHIHKIYCDKMHINTVFPSTFYILYDLFPTKLQYTFLVSQVCTSHHAYFNLPGWRLLIMKFTVIWHSPFPSSIGTSKGGLPRCSPHRQSKILKNMDFVDTTILRFYMIYASV